MIDLFIFFCIIQFRYGALSFGNLRDYVPPDFGRHAPTMFRKLAVRSVGKVRTF